MQISLVSGMLCDRVLQAILLLAQYSLVGLLIPYVLENLFLLLLFLVIFFAYYISTRQRNLLFCTKLTSVTGIFVPSFNLHI